MGRSRSRELGDCCGFCPDCGWGRRFMLGQAAGVPSVCPDCGGRVLTACPACDAPIESLMAVTCAECGEALRAPVAFGVAIRRKAERAPRAPRAGACAVVEGVPGVIDGAAPISDTGRGA